MEKDKDIEVGGKSRAGWLVKPGPTLGTSLPPFMKWGREEGSLESKTEASEGDSKEEKQKELG